MVNCGSCNRGLLVILAIGFLASATNASAVPVTEQPNNRKLLQEYKSYEEQIRAAAKKAAAFCKAPEFKKLSCGWATQKEVSSSSTTCDLCGTIWEGEVLQLPHLYTAFAGIHFRSPRFVSLACRPGRLITRAVYKMLSVPDSGYDGPILGLRELGTLGSSESAVRRCDLQLPAHNATAPKGETSKSEVDAALRSKEINCKSAADFGGLKVGKWYSDTATFNFSGCSGVSKPNATYTPTMPYIVRNPGPSFLLAKFEVQETS